MKRPWQPEWASEEESKIAQEWSSLESKMDIDEYIRRDENINHSQTYKRPITKYKPSSRASKDYFKLADEIVRRIERYENGKEK